MTCQTRKCKQVCPHQAPYLTEPHASAEFGGRANHRRKIVQLINCDVCGFARDRISKLLSKSLFAKARPTGRSRWPGCESQPALRRGGAMFNFGKRRSLTLGSANFDAARSQALANAGGSQRLQALSGSNLSNVHEWVLSTESVRGGSDNFDES